MELTPIQKDILYFVQDNNEAQQIVTVLDYLRQCGDNIIPAFHTMWSRSTIRSVRVLCLHRLLRSNSGALYITQRGIRKLQNQC